MDQSVAPLVTAKGVTVRAGQREIVTSIDLSVRPGEVVTLIGPNGAGKTTLVRAILGLQEPTSGSVSRRDNLRIGYMPQRLTIDPTLPLPVRRFLDLAGGASRARRREVLAEVGASQVWDTPLSDVSGGEFQRVLLARALLRKPDLLVLDEPAQAVDINGQTELYELIGEIRDTHGCAVLMVSHDLHIVMSSTNRVVCINGHLCCDGHPETVSRDPAYIALFGDRVAASLALYQHNHDHHHHIDGSVADGVECEPEEQSNEAHTHHG